MKKKILIIIFLFSLLAVAGGASLIYSIGHSASQMNELIMLHHVEILREQLLLDIHQVQADLYSQSTRHPVSADATINHVSAMKTSIAGCFSCHHTRSVNERLLDLQQQIGQYSVELNKAMLPYRSAGGILAQRGKTSIISDSLIGKVNTMIVLTNKKLNDRTAESLRDVNKSKVIVIMLVIAGPLMVALFGFTTLTSFATPLQTLLDATKRLKAGDLDSPVIGLKNEFAELAAGFNDMAEALRERLREIEENERRYRLLFENAADAIFILDAEGGRAGKIMSANHYAASMHGYTVEELTTMYIQDIDAPEEAKLSADRMKRILKGEMFKGESSHVKKDGTVFPIEISAAAFEFNHHQYILAIDRDTTERKRTEEALQRADQLRTAGELATGLAHEIKNPLAGIRLTMETLSHESYLAEDDRAVLFQVIEEIRRIDGLIKGLLNFARPPKPQFTATDVNAVLLSAVRLVLHNRSSKENGAPEIELKNDLSDDLPEITADPMQLRQVFMNLLMNAVDALPEGGTVGLSTSMDSAAFAVKVAITDTGKGMDASVLGKIFQPFFTTKARGTGLGLAISKRLIEDQGGRIAVENGAARGSTFSVILPIDKSKGNGLI